MIYLDSAATSLWHPKEAEERMIQALHGCGNAGRGAHDATLDAGRVVFETRMRLAELFHAESPERIAFTCNDTEALNTAIFGLFGPGDHGSRQSASIIPFCARCMHWKNRDWSFP